MRTRLQHFMYGRYGQDDLNRALLVFAIILYAVSIFTRLTILTSLGLVLLVLCIFRMFSRNARERAQENFAFLGMKGKIVQKLRLIKTWFRQRKTHRFYKCPSCKQTLRVPKGKGRIIIRCPKCQMSFEKKS